MHCIIIANQGKAFPSILLPVKGRAVVDYLIDDILIQKDITHITLMTNEDHLSLITKHLQNAYPEIHSIKITLGEKLSSVIFPGEDHLILQGNVFSSLKLQDFIRYFKQFKTVTKAAYDKNNPHEIPFSIIPKNYISHIDELPKDMETHTYNSGSGYNIITI